MQSDAQRQRQRHPPSESLRGGGKGGAGEGERGGPEGRRGGVLPKRLKFGSGHLRLDVCGPSNGRKNLASGRPGFFALLCSPPSALYALT